MVDFTLSDEQLALRELAHDFAENEIRPVAWEFDRDATKSLSKGALEIQLILERAAEESERKSERVGAAWAKKKNDAGRRIVTRKVPGWIRVEGDRLALIPDRAEVIRRIYQLALQGLGVHTIAKQLNADQVPVLGRMKFKGRRVVWNETVVFHLLRTRGVIGEYQPCRGRGSDRTPAGDPIKGYFPAAVSEETYYAVQGMLRGRARIGRGRRCRTTPSHRKTSAPRCSTRWAYRRRPASDRTVSRSR